MNNASNLYLYQREGGYLPRVAAVHDLCGYGKCSLGVAIPVLSAADLDSVEPGKPTAHVVKVFEPAKRQAGVKINEETAAESAIKAVDMMAAAKLL